MSTIAIPAHVVGIVRSAVLSALGGAAALIEQARTRVEMESHPEFFEAPLAAFDGFRALLGLTGLGAPTLEREVVVDLAAHRRALIGALRERLEVEHDHLRIRGETRSARQQRETSRHNAQAIEELLATVDRAGM